jgi:hypothetical protein
MSAEVSLLRLRAPVGRLPLGAIFGGIGLVAATAVGVLHLDRLGIPVCVFKAATGLPCPACGSTRALGRLFDQDLPGAFAMNPLATVGVLVLVPWAIADLVLMSRGRALDVELSPALGRVVRISAVLAVLLNWTYLLASGR